MTQIASHTRVLIVIMSDGASFTSHITKLTPECKHLIGRILSIIISKEPVVMLILWENWF